MTTWREFRAERPLRGEAKRAYERERARIGVGYLVLKARAAAGFSQSQLAKRIRTSQPMVARWESGRQLPSVRTLLRIADATGFDLSVGLRDRDTGRHLVTLAATKEERS
ncbi:MAG: helix-turn-helix transcriptional regulator [Gammaproteobacteria bacterium]